MSDNPEVDNRQSIFVEKRDRLFERVRGARQALGDLALGLQESGGFNRSAKRKIKKAERAVDCAAQYVYRAELPKLRSRLATEQELAPQTQTPLQHSHPLPEPACEKSQPPAHDQSPEIPR